jgi:hypothetical protein
VLLAYQDQKEGSEILDRWHATNKKFAKKAKSEDNPNSSASRQSAFSLPHTDTEHKLDVGVDKIQDLDDCPIQFQYGKDFYRTGVAKVQVKEILDPFNYKLL